MVGGIVSGENTVRNLRDSNTRLLENKTTYQHKMKKLLFALVAAALLASCNTHDPKEDLYVYLCIGQSNMVGAIHTAHPEAQDSVISDRFINLSAVDDVDRQLGEWRPALPPLCRYSTGLCPVDYFGRKLLEYLPEEKKVGVIHVAVDGTAIRLFDKDQYQGYCDSIQPDWMNNEVNFYDRNPYERLITLAKKAQEEGTIKGILLHQGCTDAYSTAWYKTVNKVYTDILTDLNLKAEDVPLLVGEAIGSDQNGVCQHANPTIDRIQDYIPTAHVISSRACEAGFDHLHFSAAGYRRLGTRYGIKMLQLMGYDVPDDTENELQTSSAEDAFTVETNYDPETNKFKIETEEQIAAVDIVSYSGATLATLELGGTRNTEIDLSPYDGEDRLVINIITLDGKVVNRQVNR